MKIVLMDGLCRENHSDVLIAEHVHDQYAEGICAFLQSQVSPSDGETWFTVKPDNYKLYVFEP